jgi:predicted nucleotidyltransferase
MKVNGFKNKIKEIAKKYNLDLVLLFGSQVRDKKYLHKESDFDIAYLAKKDLNLMEESKLICDIMAIFKSERIDLVNLKRADPLLMKQIFENHKILYCKDPKIYSLYQIYALKRYIEAKPLFELNRQSIEHFLKQHKTI